MFNQSANPYQVLEIVKSETGSCGSYVGHDGLRRVCELFLSERTVYAEAHVDDKGMIFSV